MRTYRWSDICIEGQAFHIARVTCSPTTHRPHHAHDYAELFWVEVGLGRHQVNGRRVALQPGDLVLIRPADGHTLDAAGEQDFVFVNVAFPEAMLAGLRERYFSSETRFFWSEAPLPWATRLAGPAHHEMRRQLQRLATGPRGRLDIERFLINLLYDAGQPGSEPEQCDAPDWLAAACAAIRQPESLAGGVHAFYRLAGRSPEHVAREMRRWLGCTPTEYVTRVRLERSAAELCMSGKTVSQIAAESGFANLAHFYSVFHERYGMAPRQYRLRSQAHHG